MFTPRINDDLTVTLPAETMRAKVVRVLDRMTVIVQIGQPMMRTHNFRLGDMVACRRTPGVLGESWQALEVRAALPDLSAVSGPSTLEAKQKPRGFAKKPAGLTPKPAKEPQLASRKKGSKHG